METEISPEKQKHRLEVACEVRLRLDHLAKAIKESTATDYTSILELTILELIDKERQDNERTHRTILHIPCPGCRKEIFTIYDMLEHLRCFEDAMIAIEKAREMHTVEAELDIDALSDKQLDKLEHSIITEQKRRASARSFADIEKEELEQAELLITPPEFPAC